MSEKKDDDTPSLYKLERAKYKALFPRVKTHHLKPHERGTDDSEFNLFPWNLASHDAWHRLFYNLTPREVWPLLTVAYRQIWHSEETETKPVWRWEHRVLFCYSERREFSHVRGMGFWQERWQEAFGGATLLQAQHLMRCMMMTMAFGHIAYTDEIDNLGLLNQLIKAIPPGDRTWAFETCFKRPLGTHRIPTIRRQIRELIRRTQSARP